MNGAGFYKREDGSDELLYGLYIAGTDLNLTPDDPTATADGWAWFESEQEARDAYGLPPGEVGP